MRAGDGRKCESRPVAALAPTRMLMTNQGVFLDLQVHCVCWRELSPAALGLRMCRVSRRSWKITLRAFESGRAGTNGTAKPHRSRATHAIESIVTDWECKVYWRNERRCTPGRGGGMSTGGGWNQSAYGDGGVANLFAGGASIRYNLLITSGRTGSSKQSPPALTF
jgi:hypothetical protein